MVLTRFRCMICDRVTEPEPELADDITSETIEPDVCDECKNAVLFVRKVLSNDGAFVTDERGRYQLLKYRPVIRHVKR